MARPIIKKSPRNLTGVDLTQLGSVSGGGNGVSGHGMLAMVERESGRWAQHQVGITRVWSSLDQSRRRSRSLKSCGQG
jgi:hypothetical protein